MIVPDTLNDLRALPESARRDEYLAFVATRGVSAFRREGGPEHVTASCFVFSEDLRQVLLCFHRKGGFWVQFGGHVESSDGSIASAARREAREESGVDNLELLTSSILDLDRHPLNSGFTCSVHWDVGFAAVASTNVDPKTSDESEDVRWFPMDALPTEVPPDFGLRVLGMQQAANAALLRMDIAADLRLERR